MTKQDQPGQLDVSVRAEGKMMTRRAAVTFSLLLMLAAGAAPAAAQVEIPNIDPNRSSDLAVDQIGTDAPPSLEARQLAKEDPARPIDQLRPAAPADPTLSQLSRQGDSGTPPQLYRGGPTALPAAALSTPAQGRTGTVTRVGGNDRCDPQSARAASAACSRVIETRSAEFERLEPAPLSPEQRLLIEQRGRSAREAGAARRLAGNAADPDQASDQEIASVVLQGTGAGAPATAPAEEEAVPTEDAAALAAAIAEMLQNRPN